MNIIAFLKTPFANKKDICNFSYAFFGLIVLKFITSITSFFSVICAESFLPAGIFNSYGNGSSSLFWIIMSLKNPSALIYIFYLSRISRKYISKKLESKISILLLALTSFIIAFLPTYNSIGYVSTAIFTITQIIQGLCGACESPFILLDTINKNKANKNIISSLLSTSSSMGVFFISFSSHRIPFKAISIIGGIAGILAFCIREYLSDDITILSDTDNVVEKPISLTNNLQTVKKFAYLIVPLNLFTGAYISLIGKWWLEAVERLQYPCASNAREMIGYAILLGLIFRILFGFVGDRLGTRKVFIIGVVLSIFTAPTLFYLSYMNYPLMGLIIASIPGSIFQSLLFKYILDTTGDSLSKTQLSNTWNIVGGCLMPLTASILSTLCYDVGGGITYAVLYSMIISLITLGVILTTKNRSTQRFTETSA